MNPRRTLLSIPGLDTATGIRQLDDNESFYRKVLMRFRDDHAQRFPVELAAALDTKDYSGATRMVHSLKGVTATIGAISLSEQCAALEPAIQTGDAQAIARLVRPLLAELRALADALAAISESP